MKGLSQREKEIASAANNKKFRDSFDKKQHNIDLNIEEMIGLLELLKNHE